MRFGCDENHTESLDSSTASEEADEKHNEEDHKEDLGEARRHTGNSEETKRPCNQGNNQENQRVM